MLSAACLDFFFTQPVFRFYVSNPLNLLALIAFLVTALVITRLVSRARPKPNPRGFRKTNSIACTPFPSSFSPWSPKG